MPFPLIPILLVAVVGGGAYVLAQKSAAPSDQPVVKHGVRYGIGCTTVQVVDLVTFMKYIETKSKSLESSLNPDMPAKEALAIIARAFFPGPGCVWSTDGSFDPTFLTPDGQADAQWKDLLVASGDMSLGEAVQSGAWAALGGLGMQNASASPSAFDFLLGPALRGVV